jgi:hypothetical protein
MKLYIASHSQRKALRLLNRLAAAGHEVTSRWITQDTKFHLGASSYTNEEKTRIALMDEEDVRRAERKGRYIPGGKHVEVGIALGLGLPVYVLGSRENILYWHPRVQVFRSTRELLAHLAHL